MKLEDEIYFKNTMMQFCLIIKGKTVERAADLVVLLRSGSVLRKWSDPYSYSKMQIQLACRHTKIKKVGEGGR